MKFNFKDNFSVQRFYMFLSSLSFDIKVINLPVKSYDFFTQNFFFPNLTYNKYIYKRFNYNKSDNFSKEYFYIKIIILIK